MKEKEESTKKEEAGREYNLRAKRGAKLNLGVGSRRGWRRQASKNTRDGVEEEGEGMRVG